MVNKEGMTDVDLWLKKNKGGKKDVINLPIVTRERTGLEMSYRA